MTTKSSSAGVGWDRMGLYSQSLLPRLIHFSIGQAELLPYRRGVVAGARGRILEFGIGSGRNLRFYGEAVEDIIGIDPSREILALAQPALAAFSRKVTLLPQSAESLPLEGRCIDTVVVTWSLCSIADPGAALREARRVLKLDGQLRFVELGSPPIQVSAIGSVGSRHYGATALGVSSRSENGQSHPSRGVPDWGSRNRLCPRSSFCGVHV
jgi:SAM-dependent methyltransferase